MSEPTITKAVIWSENPRIWVAQMSCGHHVHRLMTDSDPTGGTEMCMECASPQEPSEPQQVAMLKSLLFDARSERDALRAENTRLREREARLQEALAACYEGLDTHWKEYPEHQPFIELARAALTPQGQSTDGETR